MMMFDYKGAGGIRRGGDLMMMLDYKREMGGGGQKSGEK